MASLSPVGEFDPARLVKSTKQQSVVDSIYRGLSLFLLLLSDSMGVSSLQKHLQSYPTILRCFEFLPGLRNGAIKVPSVFIDVDIQAPRNSS